MKSFFIVLFAIIAVDAAPRQKRDIPSQSEINLAQRIKFCMESNKETDSTNCMTKVLGSNVQNVDTIKLLTIINYEAVLEELKEYFKAKEEGKTLKEFLESQKAKRPKRDVTQSEINLAQRIKFCMESSGEKDSASCMTKILGSKIENVDTVKLQAIINYEAVLEELKEYFKAKEQGKTLKEFLESQKAKRPKRDIPTQSEINLAQRIKFCMESNGEKDSANCLTKILGSKIENVDTVKLQAIINYEAVLEELKEYFKAKEEGKTLKEFLESQKAKRPKRDVTQSEINLAQRIKFCMESNGETDSVNCMAKILGSNAQNVDTVKLQTIINYEAVLQELKEYFKAKEQGKTLKEFLESKKAALAG